VHEQPEQGSAQRIHVRAAERMPLRTRPQTPHPSVAVKPRNAIRHALFHCANRGPEFESAVMDVAVAQVRFVDLRIFLCCMRAPGTWIGKASGLKCAGLSYSLTPHPSVAVKPRNAIRHALFHFWVCADLL
jgi:hypothetical protein